MWITPTPRTKKSESCVCWTEELSDWPVLGVQCFDILYGKWSLSYALTQVNYKLILIIFRAKIFALIRDLNEFRKKNHVMEAPPPLNPPVRRGSTPGCFWIESPWSTGYRVLLVSVFKSDSQFSMHVWYKIECISRIKKRKIRLTFRTQRIFWD